MKQPDSKATSMSLTDNEKYDAVRFVEAGKPLPDNYRFLLSEDKRDVELVGGDNKLNAVSPVEQLGIFHDKKAWCIVAIDLINLPVTYACSWKMLSWNTARRESLVPTLWTFSETIR